MHPESMCRRVVQECADIGVAFDGDGDRNILCDAKGDVVNGDQVLAVLATYMKKKRHSTK